MITLPSLNNLPSKWDEIRHWLESRVFECGVMPHPNLTECEAKQFERDFWDNIGCAPEEYVRIRRAIRLLEARYPDSLNELVCAAIATPLEQIGTEFQKQAWDALLAIPYGETRSYKEQAQRLGNPKAVRAVAAANGQNKVSILIPCHRVIGSDGKLTGYAGGLNRKQFLLALEHGEVQTALF